MDVIDRKMLLFKNRTFLALRGLEIGPNMTLTGGGERNNAPRIGIRLGIRVEVGLRLDDLPTSLPKLEGSYPNPNPNHNPSLPYLMV
jgi:hypothetical protein